MLNSNIFQVALMASFALSQNEKIKSVTPNQSTAHYKTRQNPNLSVSSYFKTKLSQNQEFSSGYWSYNRSITTKEIEENPPVYISHSHDKEHLIYNRKKMKVGKLYKIEWLGQKLALTKRADDHVDLYEFFPNKK